MVLLLSPLILCAERITFVFEVYPPYEFYEGDNLVGTDVDVIREVCRRMEIDPVFRELPWARALKEVRDGKADAIFSLLKTRERLTFLYFPAENLSYEHFVFVAPRGSGISLKGPQDLKGRRVGVCRGYDYDPAFDARKDFIREFSLHDEEQLRKLQAGRMELAIMNRQVFTYTARRMGLKDFFEILEYEITPAHPMYVGFSRAKGPHAGLLAEQFDKVLKKMKEQGVFQKIQERYP